jgi:hypothetical protein
MLEPVTLFLTALAAAFVIIETAFTSIAGSIAAILAALVGALLSLSGMCSALAAVLPPAKEIGFYSKLHSLVNKIAFNVGRAQNRVAKIDDSGEKN